MRVISLLVVVVGVVVVGAAAASEVVAVKSEDAGDDGDCDKCTFLPGDRNKGIHNQPTGKEKEIRESKGKKSKRFAGNQRRA